MPKLIDNIYAIRLAVLLYKDWSTWDAYKHGIIDRDGNKLKDPKGPTEQASWTYLHRLASNIKKMISKVPGGRTMIGKAVAHYALFRESIGDTADEQLLEQFDDMYWPTVMESDHLIEGIELVLPEFKDFINL